MERRPLIKRCPHCQANGMMLRVERIPAGSMRGFMGGRQFTNQGSAGIDLACRRCGWRRAHVSQRDYLPAQDEQYRAARR